MQYPCIGSTTDTTIRTRVSPPIVSLYNNQIDSLRDHISIALLKPDLKTLR